MKILVTGAAGFIGSHLSEALVEKGHEVVALDAFTDYYSRALKTLNAQAIRQKGVRLRELDLVESNLDEILDGVEVIYHFAAQPGISATTSLEKYVRNNIYATDRLVRASAKADSLKCFINIATSSVYGAHATDPEDCAPKPTSYYGVSKLAAEQIALARYRTHNFPACSLRLFSVYGERERPEKLYPKLIRAILEDHEFPLYEGSKKHSRSFTYVADIVQGCCAVLDKMEQCIGEIFNIGSDIEITTGDGIAIVEDILGKKARFAMRPPREGDQLRTHANIDKARSILGYAPVTHPEQGLRREVEWYQNTVFGKVDF